MNLEPVAAIANTCLTVRGLRAFIGDPFASHHGSLIAMQRQLAGLMAALLLSFVCSPASAQSVRLEQYQHPSEPKFETFNRLYLAGVRDGLIAYSVAAKEHLFCLPPATVLSPEQTEDIMLRFAEKRHLPGNILIALPLLGGLREAYPCDKTGD